MLGWVVLGSSLTLVIAFAVTTYYYRGRARKTESKNTRLIDKKSLFQNLSKAVNFYSPSLHTRGAKQGEKNDAQCFNFNVVILLGHPVIVCLHVQNQ